MAVVGVTEDIERSGIITFDAREYERVFKVFTDDPLDDQTVVRTASFDGVSVPQIDDLFPSDLEAKCTDISLDIFEGNPQIWEIRCRYGSSSLRFGPTGNPLLRPPILEIDGVQTLETVEREPFHDDRPSYDYGDDPRSQEEAFTLTRDGLISRPVVNVNREWFDPPVQIDVSRLNVVLTRNEMFLAGGRQALNLDLVNRYMGSVNGDEFDLLGLHLLPRQARMTNLRVRFQNENGFLFWTVTYELQLRAETWVKEIANRGYTTWRENADTTNIEWGRVKDDNGQDASEPQWLNYDGSQLPHDRVQAAFPYLRFFVYPEMPFAALLLPREMTDLV